VNADSAEAAVVVAAADSVEAVVAVEAVIDAVVVAAAAVAEDAGNIKSQFNPRKGSL
jgi:hypothetical protein